MFVLCFVLFPSFETLPLYIYIFFFFKQRQFFFFLLLLFSIIFFILCSVFYAHQKKSTSISVRLLKSRQFLYVKREQEKTIAIYIYDEILKSCINHNSFVIFHLYIYIISPSSFTNTIDSVIVIISGG